jgi:hypothetical protein
VWRLPYAAIALRLRSNTMLPAGTHHLRSLYVSGFRPQFTVSSISADILFCFCSTGIFKERFVLAAFFIFVLKLW